MVGDSLGELGCAPRVAAGAIEYLSNAENWSNMVAKFGRGPYILSAATFKSRYYFKIEFLSNGTGKPHVRASLRHFLKAKQIRSRRKYIPK
nr:hypothetical protein [Mesorhizobium sp.]